MYRFVAKQQLIKTQPSVIQLHCSDIIPFNWHFYISMKDHVEFNNAALD